MTPLERVLSRLPGAKKSGQGWSARCPAHEDRKPSLSVGQGQDGRVLVHCHAGCDVRDVLGVVGLKFSDLWPRHSGRSLEEALEPSEWFSNPEAAIHAYQRGMPSREWSYRDEEDIEVGRIVRWDLPNGRKVVRPVSLFEGAWRRKWMPSPRPLFNLVELLSQWQQSVFVVEGEKAVDALQELGLIGTTSAGGSAAAALTDWTPLAGQKVAVLPDNDEAGQRYAAKVCRILSRLNAVVTTVRLPGLQVGGDVVDALKQCKSEEEKQSLKDEIQSLAHGVSQ